MTDEESKTILKLMDGHVARLREQGFDSVQIFCTKYDDTQGTRFWETHGGNYLAVVGHSFLWIEQQKRNDCRKEND